MEVFRKYGDKLLFALALAVLLTGFFRLTISSRNLAREAALRSTVVFSHWWGAYLEENTLMTLKDEFENLHEGITIIFNNVSYEELRLGLLNTYLNGADPEERGDEDGEGGSFFLGDLFAFDLLWAAELNQRGLIGENWIDQRNGAFSRGQILSYINVLYYNIDILIEAGFSSPPKTRSEFLDYARAVTGSGRWGLNMDLNSSRGIYDEVFPWFWAAGIELIRNDRPEANNRQVIDSLSFISSLYNEGLVAPGPSGQKLEDFISGRAAFIVAPEWNIPYIRERMGEDAFSVTNIPIPDNYMGRSFYSAAGWALELNPASMVSAEARLFADFLRERSAFLSEKAGTISGTNIPRPGADPHYSKIWDLAIDAEIAGDFRGFPWTPLEEIFREELSALIGPGDSAAAEPTPAAAAAAIQRRWLEVISR